MHSDESGSASPAVVALLFTDLVGSTELLERLGDDAAEALRREHFHLLRQAVARAGGHEVKSLGDGMMATFESPVRALSCGIDIQRSVAAHNAGHPDRPLALRVGIHVGEPLREEGDFFGTSVVVTRRLCDRARGGQILASDLIRGLVGSRGDFRFRHAGPLRLKGLSEAVPAVIVEWEPTSVPDSGRAQVARGSEEATTRPVRGPRLVGRETELAGLESERRQAGRSGFRCVLLMGEAGVGKTRLAGELLARHRRRMVGLSARAYPLGVTTPFGLWAEALDGHLRHLAPDEVSRLCGGFLDDLAGLLRSVAAVRGGAPEREATRHEVMEGLAVVLGNLARAEPVVVVLDDVHLADASSWEALAYLARNATTARLLVLAVARPGELAEHPVAHQVLLGLEQEGFLRRVGLAPLGREELAVLAEGVLEVPPPGPLVDWLVERSRGNALFALGLLQALLDEGGDLAAPRLRALPEGLAERVTGRLRLLDEPTLATLEVLAVLGRRVELGELARISARPVDRLGSILDALVRTRFVVEAETGRELAYEVAHPLVAEAVYQGIGGARRRALHRLVGRALLAFGDLAGAASHFARSADTGDAEAVGTLRDALRQARQQQAYPEALAILGALVELLPEEDARWLDVLDAMAWEPEWVIVHRADFDEAQALPALRAIDALMGDEPDAGRRASVKFGLTSLLLWGMVELDEAEGTALEALDLFQRAGESRRAVLAACELTVVRALKDGLGESEEELEGLVAEADRTGDPFAVEYARAHRAWLLLLRGRLEAAGNACAEALSVTGPASGASLRSHHLTILASSLGFRGRLEEGRARLAEAKVHNPAYKSGTVLDWEITLHWLAGDFEAALSTAAEVTAWNPGRLAMRRAIGLSMAAVAAAEVGRLELGRQYLDRAVAACGSDERVLFRCYCPVAAGVLAFHQDDRGQALMALRQGTAWLLGAGVSMLAPFALLDLTEVAARAGQAEVLAEASQRLEQGTGGLPWEPYRSLGALGAAWCRLAAGDRAGAVSPAEEAASTLAALGYRGLAGRALDVLGRARAGQDRPGAVQALERAAEIHRACGATWRWERSLEALRALGGRGRRAAGAVMGRESLSRREREVARLTAEGRTAREIAEALYLSRRTVESHLAAAYAKLGVASKLELVRRARELDL